ncbi:MAG: MFS transporter [Suipraeoptans sp.]
MLTLLLIVIYITFISLGLPDSLFGSAWSTIRMDFGIGLSMASPITMTISFCTVISSLSYDFLVKKFKTQYITTVSVLFTALALFGFSLVGHYAFFIVLAIPLGLGAGAVDTGLNNYVAVHFKPHHMGWLHGFWGLGALLGPMLMSIFLGNDGGWRTGYKLIGIIQFTLVAVLIISLPLWKHAKPNSAYVAKEEPTFKGPVIRTPGLIFAMLIFLFYCGVEQSFGVWAASYFTEVRGLSASVAARWSSFYFIGLTIGRFATGFLTFKFTNIKLIRFGVISMLTGALLFIIPGPNILSLLGLIVTGVGSAPIFPSMIHETPARFGVAMSQKIMGIQMASSYVGVVLIPPIVGAVADLTIGIVVLPIFIMIFSILLFICNQALNSVKAS